MHLKIFLELEHLNGAILANAVDKPLRGGFGECGACGTCDTDDTDGTDATNATHFPSRPVSRSSGNNLQLWSGSLTVHICVDARMLGGMRSGAVPSQDTPFPFLNLYEIH